MRLILSKVPSKNIDYIMCGLFKIIIQIFKKVMIFIYVKCDKNHDISMISLIII